MHHNGGEGSACAGAHAAALSVDTCCYLCIDCVLPGQYQRKMLNHLCMWLPYLCTVWEVSHCGEEGVFWVEDASLAHVPDLETRDQAGHQDTWLAS